jgi:broad specificity phosphatase PhoE
MNTQNVSSGRTDTPLTDLGKKQATLAGQEAKHRNITFDLIICSPLSRARQTAELFATEVGYPTEDILIIEELIERNFGDLEGKNITAHFGIHESKYYSEPKSVDHIPNIETIEQLHRRVEAVFEDITNHSENTVLLVGHAAFLRSLQRVINKLPYDHPVNSSGNAQLMRLL